MTYDHSKKSDFQSFDTVFPLDSKQTHIVTLLALAA